MPNPLHTLLLFSILPMRVLCTPLYFYYIMVKIYFLLHNFYCKKIFLLHKMNNLSYRNICSFPHLFLCALRAQKKYEKMKNRKSISQAIIIQCCYKRYTAGSYAAENKSNVKMLQDKNKCGEATQKLCQVSYVFFKICKSKTKYLEFCQEYYEKYVTYDRYDKIISRLF